MGSTGEPDRKRRHFSSISPTAATAAAKKHPFCPPSEDKKLDTAVLQYQNQKLVQKLEAQKVEYSALENKFSKQKERQEPYSSTLEVVNKSWLEVVTDLEARSTRTRESSCGKNSKRISVTENGTNCAPQDAFLSRLLEAGATESSSADNCPNQMEEDRDAAFEKSKQIICNMVAAIENLWKHKKELYAAALNELQEAASQRKNASTELMSTVEGLRSELNDLHLSHKSLTMELQRRQDNDAKNKAELKRIRGEFEASIKELGENNSKLATLKAERDATKRGLFPVLNLGSNNFVGDRIKDGQKELNDLESALKKLTDQASDRLLELKVLHEERIEILEKLYNLQNTLKSVKCLSSSHAFLLVRNQLEKSKSELSKYQAQFEKLQVGKDNIAWKEMELNMKIDLADVSQRSSAFLASRIADIKIEVQEQIDEKIRIETKLEEASREPERKEIIAEFKALVSSFPEEMSTMQRDLSRYKEAASDIHSLQADVQSLSGALDRKAKECETLIGKSADQDAEIHKLRAMVQGLKDSDTELRLILDMYRRESTDLRDISEARGLEYKAWAHVHSLKISLDEQSLELRVKTANEAEAISQQRLAAAEAEIADMRQKFETFKREMVRLSDALKSKNEEIDAYLLEIESIGQSYDEMQTQNQQLLQQITERDDYNIKLVLEGVKAKQLQDKLLMDKRRLERDTQRANASFNFYNMKASKIEDQLKYCLDQVQKLAEDRAQTSVNLDNSQKRLSDLKISSVAVRESLEESQSKASRSRLSLMEVQIELERERFDKRRIEEDVEVAKRKLSRLQVQSEGLTIVQELRQELREYREILKCSICHDRPKEVVITKCFHLFCNPCVQRITESRHRKCPACAASFSPNDVKPVYI